MRGSFVFMKTVCLKDACNGCGACVDACHKDCISIVRECFSTYALIDAEKCINCKKCEKVCPNINLVNKNKPIEWYQGWAENNIRNQAASGGVASAIMMKFIENGGYVAACLFDNGRFVFKITNNEEKIKSFAGSKYVKSDPQGIYNSISEIIGKFPVLFIGLPCQVAAVKNYFKDNDKLFTIDLICHGTPSSLMLDKFLKDKKCDINNIKDVLFRSTNSSENKYTKLDECVDEYMLAFLYSICYTNNCYGCKFAERKRVSDITLGDSWGTDISEELSKGISLILIQNTKGHKLVFESGVELKPVDINVAIENNHQLREPVPMTKAYHKFVIRINKGDTFSRATFKAIPNAVIIQKLKKIKNYIARKNDKNQFGIRILK